MEKSEWKRKDSKRKRRRLKLTSRGQVRRVRSELPESEGDQPNQICSVQTSSFKYLLDIIALERRDQQPRSVSVNTSQNSPIGHLPER
jgi:hypothetical protein